MERKLTREVKIGSLKMGGTNPIIIQSMCNTDTRDVEATVAQILALEKAGCELVRVAIPDMAAADAVGEIKKRIHIPLVADIHFDYRLALRVMELGIDKVRINPGNIGDEARIKQVVDMAKEKQIPIRIGVNSGSLEKGLIEKYTLETNKKEVYFKLTERGKVLFKEHEKRHKQWEKRDMQFLSRYSKEETDTILKFMQEFNVYLDEQIEQYITDSRESTESR